MVTTDLLTGVAIGMAFGIFFTLRQSYYHSHSLKDVISNEQNQETHHIVLAEDLSFFSKPSLLLTLNKIPSNTKVIIDGSNSKSIAFDVLQLIKDYKINAQTKNIAVETINIFNC
jgi:SulP family sulfate permease